MNFTPPIDSATLAQSEVVLRERPATAGPPCGEVVLVILSGGAGARLWPASRASRPKQFIPLVGARSTFQTALQRVSDSPLFGRPIVLANDEHRFIVAEQITEISVAVDIVLEPDRRDSAVAIAVAALCVARNDPRAVVLAVAADHMIGDDASFRDSVDAAAALARQGYIMTLGIVPTEPSPSFGYIRPGMKIANSDAFEIDCFVEKPNETLASEYLAQGYMWNSGNFVFRADVMLTELDRHAPTVLAAARAAFEQAQHHADLVCLDAAAFKAAPVISIDYAVMERTQHAAVLPVRYSWSDIGNWGAVWDVSAHDENGNMLRGNVEVSETRNSLIHSDHILTAVVGVDDIVVVTEPDAVLVTTRARSAEIKSLVASMRKKGRPEADEHERVHRPWGWYQRVDIGTRFQVKRICVKPGGRLSLQKHFHRAEHWVVVRGTAEVQVNDQCTIAPEGEAVYLPLGAVHRLSNPGRIPLELVEVQVGSYTGEDDIVRMDDLYGRC